MSKQNHPHAITIEKHPKRVTVTWNGSVVAQTRQALILKEGTLPPAYYVPRQDVSTSYLQRTDHSTRCPFKGEASYFSVTVNGKTADNAVWTYENPIDDVAAIKDHLSFYKEKMDAIEESSEE